jgi:hypothetical protein
MMAQEALREKSGEQLFHAIFEGARTLVMGTGT